MRKAAAKEAKFGAHFTQTVRFSANAGCHIVVQQKVIDFCICSSLGHDSCENVHLDHISPANWITNNQRPLSPMGESGGELLELATSVV